MRIRILVLFSLLLAAVPALAAPPEVAYSQSAFNPRMLDVSVPLAERQELFAELVKLADSGRVRAQELAGTLYWQGDKTAGSPVAVNLDQARVLLSNAAVRGDVLAMAKLAELELEAGRNQQAMTWAQLYAHYLDPTLSTRAAHGRNFGYASSLMDRILDAGGKIDEGVSASVNGVAAKYNDAIRHGIDAFRDQSRSGDVRLINRPDGAPLVGEDTLVSGAADFMVAFDTDGKPQQVWQLASFPEARAAALVRPWLDAARINRGGADGALRYMQVTIRLDGHKSRQLRAH